MTTSDFESRLDDALNQLVGGTVTNDPGSDVSELISVARGLQIIAPTPEPNLANGRRRLLTAAAHVDESPARLWHSRFSFALVGVLAIVVLSVLTMTVMAGGSLFAQTVTPTMSPTYTTTPTRISFVPSVDAVPNSIQLNDTQPSPAPIPTPLCASVRVISHSAARVAVQCLTF